MINFVNGLSLAELSPTERLFLMSLYLISDEYGSCTYSYNQLVGFTGLSSKTISRLVTRLSNGGFITYLRGDRSKSEPNTYYLEMDKIVIQE